MNRLFGYLQFVENVDWTRLWWIAGVLATFWAGLAAITLVFPAFDPWYKVINIVLSAAVGAALFAARGGKYVASRTEPPQDGRP
jgi:hypothetical protein